MANALISSGSDTHQPCTLMARALVSGLDQVATIIDVIEQLPTDQRQQCFVAIGVGKHLRHIYDHFLAVQAGSVSGHVDYNLRNRGGVIEVDLAASRQQLNVIVAWCQSLPQVLSGLEQAVSVESEVDCMQEASMAFESTILREFLYLINHTIHHVAYTKLLLSTQNVELPASVGLAPSTATFERTAAQKIAV